MFVTDNTVCKGSMIEGWIIGAIVFNKQKDFLTVNNEREFGH